MHMSENDSITLWLNQLKAGEVDAASKLWDRYFQRLVGLARMKLAASSKREADEEDVALSAFKSLCMGAQHGKFPQLLDRDSLWPLLAVIASRKSCDQSVRERRLKRGGGKVFGENDFATGVQGESPIDLLVSTEPSPEAVAEMSEECERLLNLLDDNCRQIALLKLEGYTNAEIVSRVNLSPRTVDRKLQLIRDLWSEQT